MEESERRVAVVGDDDRADTLREAVRDAGGRLVAAGDVAATPDEAAGSDGGPNATADSTPTADSVPDATLAVGETATRSALRDATTETVIPLGTHRLAFGVDGAAAQIRRLLAALDAPVDGIGRVSHPILAVDAGTQPTYRAVADVALVTEEPARISEFSVRPARGRAESFRADGVTVATPFGSGGYANAVGGPIVELGGGLSVVPIAPFTTRTDARVAAERVTLSVERETEPVSLVVDGTVRETVDPHRPIEIAVRGQVDALVPASSASPRPE